MKNLTLLSSILGTWSTWTHLSARIPGLGRYEVMAYFVVHFVPDPTRQNACDSSSLEQIDNDDHDHDDGMSCREWDNMICQNTHEEMKHAQPKCFNMTSTNSHDDDFLSDWSDMSAYYTIGISMSAGFPFHFDNEHRDTGDSWIGPYSIILAQQPTDYNSQPHDTRNTSDDDGHDDESNDSNDNDADTDTFAIRYVRTASTAHLQRYPMNQTLFPFEGYLQSFGPDAVTATIAQQATLQHGQDPHVHQHDTCQNGNITPILPLYQFSKKKKTRTTTTARVDDDNDDDDDWDVQVDYRSLISPSTENLAYKWMPWIQKQVNQRGLGFTVDGPYCYFDDPHRAWTVSVSMDTVTMNDNRDSTYIKDANNIDSTMSRATRRKQQQQQQQASRTSTSGRVLNVVHACVEGLPCIPPNVMSTFYDTSSSWHNGNHHHGMVPNEALDLDSGFVVWCIIIVVVLLVTSIVSCTCCICQGLRHKRVVKSLLQADRVPDDDDDDGEQAQRHALLGVIGNADDNDDTMISIPGGDDATENGRGDDDPGNAAPAETPPAIEELVVDDALLTQPLLSSQGTSSTASLEQKKNNSVASTSSAAAAAAGVDKGQREGIV